MKNVLVLTYWSFRSGLIQAYTLPYVRMIARRLSSGGKVFFVTLEQDGLLVPKDSRAEVRAELAKDGIEWVPFHYARFGAGAIFKMAVTLIRLWWLSLYKGVDAIHCFCTPAGALGSLLSLATGKRLILDSYEPHAEGMLEYGVWKREGLAFRLLFALERLQTRRAAAVIATAPGMRDYALSRYGVALRGFHVKPACVDLEAFRPDRFDSDRLRRELGLDGKIVAIYAGKTGGTYLDREIFDLLKAASEYWPGRFRALFLTSDEPDIIYRFCDQARLDKSELLVRFVDHKDIPGYMAMADFAITPVKPVPLKRLCAPIKNGEYWAMGLPVIITPNIASDSELIAERRIGAVLTGLDQEAYRAAVREIDGLLQGRPRQELSETIRGIATEMRSMNLAEDVYTALYGPPRT
ncbi:MAG: glycosyltransferase [Elusimicrobia bacterium]|nr:glycosyltransferase [Elusimicrobiota bacterium]